MQAEEAAKRPQVEDDDDGGSVPQHSLPPKPTRQAVGPGAPPGRPAPGGPPVGRPPGMSPSPWKQYSDPNTGRNFWQHQVRAAVACCDGCVCL